MSAWCSAASVDPPTSSVVPTYDHVEPDLSVCVDAPIAGPAVRIVLDCLAEEYLDVEDLWSSRNVTSPCKYKPKIQFCYTDDWTDLRLGTLFSRTLKWGFKTTVHFEEQLNSYANPGNTSRKALNQICCLSHLLEKTLTPEDFSGEDKSVVCSKKLLVSVISRPAKFRMPSKDLLLSRLMIKIKRFLNISVVQT